jgi:WD40 repeat protein
MKLFPRETFTIRTADPLPLIQERLSAKVLPRKPMTLKRAKTGVFYQGVVLQESFEIGRIINYRNSALPTIYGRFELLPEGTAIHISMGMHPLVIGFLGFWYLSWYSAVIPIVLMVQLSGIGLLFIVMPTLLLVVLLLVFRSEANRSRIELTQILLGQVELEPMRGNVPQFPLPSKRFAILALGFIVMSAYVLALLNHSSKSAPQSQMLENEIGPCIAEKTKSSDCNYAMSRVIGGHPSAKALAISDDGQTLVSGGFDKTLKVWDIASGKLRWTLPSASGHINAVAIAPDGKIAATGSEDRMARLWDLTTGRQLAMLKGHQDEVTAVAIRAEDRSLVSGSRDGTIKVWDLTTARLKATYETSLKNVKTIGPLTIDNSIEANLLALSADGTTALIGYNEGRDAVWNLRTGQLSTYLEEEFQFLPGSVMAGAISPTGEYGVIQYRTYNHGGKLNLWDLKTGKVIVTKDFTGTSIGAIPVALDGERVLGARDRQIGLWNFKTKTSANIASGWVGSIVVSADGKTIAGLANDNKNLNNALIKIWRKP